MGVEQPSDSISDISDIEDSKLRYPRDVSKETLEKEYGGKNSLKYFGSIDITVLIEELGLDTVPPSVDEVLLAAENADKDKADSVKHLRIGIRECEHHLQRLYGETLIEPV